MKKREDDIKYTIDIDIDNALKQIRQIKKEVKETVKDCSLELDKFSLKKKDILIVKLKGAIFKDKHKKEIEKKLKKKIHRKVLCIDERMELSVMER